MSAHGKKHDISEICFESVVEATHLDNTCVLKNIYQRSVI